jgi:hypothetical protein
MLRLVSVSLRDKQSVCVVAQFERMIGQQITRAVLVANPSRTICQLGNSAHMDDNFV